MWDAKPEYWKQASPVLFPIVGSLNNGSYRYEEGISHVPVESKSSIKNNSSIWIYGIFKLPHLRKIQTPRKELFRVSLPYFPVVDHTIMMNFIEIV